MEIKKTKFAPRFLAALLLISMVALLPMDVNATGEETYIVAADPSANSNYILSHGDGTFGSQEYMGQTPQPLYSYGNGIGDFDNDGDFDYVIGTGNVSYERNVYLYEKLSSGNDFASPISVDTWTEGWYPVDFAVADYNNDGNMDFVLTHYNSSNSELYLGNGDLSFIRSVLSDTSPLYSVGADSADFNNDGNPDFATAEYGSPPIEEIGKPDLPYDGHNPYYIYINLGNGDGTFTTTSFQANNSTFGVTAGDFDNDDDADIITAYYGAWYFYKGNGDGTFQPGTVIAGVDSYFSPIDNFDFDNDGDQDIVIGYLDSVHYYAGYGDATFTFMAEITGGIGDQRIAISAPPAEVIPGAPRAIASPKYQALPLEGGTADFDGSASYDEDGWIVSYQWDFGDGSYGTGAIVSHEYSAQVEETLHRVKLTVTDNEEKAAYHIVYVKIGNTPPKVICVPWRYGLQHETWNGNPTVLKATVKDTDLPLTYTWNFGDGTSESGIITSENQKFAIEATHIYPDAPEWTPFTATLTVWDPYGASGSDMYQILVKTKTLDVEVNVAIDDGLWWLHKTQDRYTFEGIDYGLWFDVGFYTGPTSTSVLAFEIQGHLPVGDPDEDPYVETVQRGLNFIFTQCYARSISGPSDSCPYGDPDTNGNGIGIDIDNSDRRVYEIGMAMMAIAASGGPDLVAITGPSDVVGRTYFDILTDMVDMCAWGQNDGVDPTGDTSALDASMSTNFIVNGTVKDAETGDPIEDCDVWLYDPDTHWSSGDSTDSTGSYRIVAPEDTNYMFNVKAPRGTRYVAYLEYDVAILSNTTKDVALEKGYILSGTVRDSLTGSILANCHLGLHDPETCWHSGDITDSSGFYTIAVHAGTYNLNVNPPFGSEYAGYAERDLIVIGDMAKDVFLRTGFLVSGFVTDGLTGEGVSDCWVEMWDPTTGAWNNNQTDLTGMYSFYLPAGTYEFNVGPPPDSKYEHFWQSGVEVAPGFTKDVKLYPVRGGRGGWRYDWNYGNSDNSVSQWPIIGLESAEKNWGITAPDFVKSELDLWLAYSQSVTGGFGYGSPEHWVNPAKTGAGMAGLAYIGVPPTDTRVVKAIDYLDSQWGTSGTDGYWGNYYALYAIMKGCRLFDPEVQYIGAHDWYGDDPDGFARYLVSEQLDDRRWPPGSWAGSTLTSGWAILILTPTVVFPPPVADAGPDITWGPDWPVPFDASGSYHLDPAKTIVLYEWDFDDDGVYDFSSTEPYAEHTYPTYYNPDGTINEPLTYRDYTVTLRVTDDNVPAKTDTDTCIVHTTPPPHPPIADPDGPYTGYPEQLIPLDGTGSFDIDSGSPWFDYIVSYGWELDMVWPYDFDDAFGATVQWSWDVLGTHNIGLKVNDTTGLTHTAWTTVTITPPPPEIPVYVDIKPASWPNPLKLRGRGVLPVAICGTEDFDVTTVDPETVRLTLEGVAERVASLHWSYEDVATPYTGEPCSGHDLEGDGYLDLTLKFKTQEVIATLGLDAFSDRDVVILILTGNLKEEFGGTPIQGQDCIVILDP